MVGGGYRCLNQLNIPNLKQHSVIPSLVCWLCWQIPTNRCHKIIPFCRLPNKHTNEQLGHTFSVNINFLLHCSVRRNNSYDFGLSAEIKRFHSVWSEYSHSSHLLSGNIRSQRHDKVTWKPGWKVTKKLMAIIPMATQNHNASFSVVLWLAPSLTMFLIEQFVCNVWATHAGLKNSIFS